MTRSDTIRGVALLGLLVLLLVPVPARAQLTATDYEGAAALGLELRRLGTTKRVLMIGAHPDDESTQILSTLALGQGAEVAYLSLTRGEGGQNGIGPELQEGLGLLRSEELLAARRLDGARQYFTRAYDFGFSKNADEAFRHWPRDEVLGDVVAVIRHFRPDVVLSIFSGTPRDGHGQHQAAGILAREGFEAAGDPSKYPAHAAAGLLPFAPARLYRALWGQNEDADFQLQTGDVDPLLGRSHYQVAMASRSLHRSQDMGRPLTPGPQASALELDASRGDRGAADASLFAGLDTLLSEWVPEAPAAVEGSAYAAAVPLLRQYEARVREIGEAFNPLHPGRLVDELSSALRILRSALEPLPAGELRDRGAAEAAEAEAALWRAASLRLTAVAGEETVVPGGSFELVITLWNGGERAVSIDRLEPLLPEGWSASAPAAVPATLAPGELVERTVVVHVPEEASSTRPYFLRSDREGDLYSWAASGRVVGVPFETAPIRAVAEVEVAGEDVRRETEGTFIEIDPRQGEIRRPVRVVPAHSVLLTPASAVVPLSDDGGEAEPLRVAAIVRAEKDGSDGTLRLSAPEGWQVEPRSAPIRFDAAGQERIVEFTVRPPARLAPGMSTISAEFVDSRGRRYEEGYTLVDYPHVQPHPLYRAARVTVRAFPVDVPEGLRVAYIPGAGDDAPAALRQLGVEVTLLEGEAIASADLSAFDAVLTGIRAYEVNAALRANNRRLFDYARDGGTVVVQYNKYEFTDPGIAPYPVSMSRPHGRVTDEAADVHFLEPEHPVLRWPNRITADDFEAWHQERGLYFLSEWDERFTPLLEMSDPGEDPLRGSLLIAPLGEGTYVYTGLAFFRQLPEGVAGAHRLLVNLLSIGKTP